VRDTPAELAPLIERIDEIDRAACRRHVAEHFSAEAMVRGYTRLLEPELGARTAAAPMVFSAPVSPPRPMRVPHNGPSRRPDRARPAARRAVG
jgi:hypothetical protein